MEDKRKSKKVTSKKPKEKVVKKTNKKESVKKKKKAFTLIELLAVIIILGILMIIAIPSVTSYINNSRKSAYVDTAKEIVSGARNKVNEGKLDMFSTDTTYYIPTDYIETENASKSPYGEFTESYVGVTYNGQGYSYYWISRDETGQGVKEITSINDLDEDKIESDIASGEINTIVTSTGIGNRKTVKVLEKNESGVWEFVTKTENATTIPEGGSEETTLIAVVCKRAASLHTEKCTNSNTSNYCQGDGYSLNGTITYGNTTITDGVLTTGDAFDCDINGDGTYDSTTEKFYYISDYYDTSSKQFNDKVAVLVYYSNTKAGVASTTNVAYYGSSNENWHGPITAISELPTTVQWSNISLYKNTRQILGYDDATESYDYTFPTAFDYLEYSARLLTYQELNHGCYDNNISITSPKGLSTKCKFLLERTKYANSSYATSGSWLETPDSSNLELVCTWNAFTRGALGDDTNDVNYYGVRPTIEVLKSNISY